MTIFSRLTERLFVLAHSRAPDVIIGMDYRQGRPDYLRRWYVIPRNRWLNIYLHRFGRDDDDRALHDHPWLFNCSIVLRGMLAEITPHPSPKWGQIRRGLSAGDWRFRWGRSPHRLELRSPHAWTLFITGPRIREWGFYCPKGWVHWRDFTDPNDSGKIGPGCGQ